MARRRLDAVTARGRRAYADALRLARRQGSATSAMRSLGNPNRRDVSEWNRMTAGGFERYRLDHDPIQEPVGVVCVSCRPHQLAAVARNVGHQRDVDLEFVFVANDPGFDGIDIAAHFSHIPAVTVIVAEPAVALGTGLNMAMAATGTRFVAKFDDDDLYGPNYLADSLRAHGYAGAAVVGKHSYYADLASTQRRYLRFGGHDFSYSATLAGGTLVIDRGYTGDLQFDDVSLGEDRSFIAQCHRRGWSTFSADRFNFVQQRRHDNTWKATDEQFLQGAVEVEPESESHTVER